MAEEEKEETGKEGKAHIHLDLGLGGIFKGLGDFLDVVSEMAERGESEEMRTGEFKVKGLGEKGRGVYGFSVRTDIGGIPHVERFGNIRGRKEGGAVVADVREPLVDVFEEENGVVVVVELPGVSEEEIEIEVKGDILGLKTTGDRRYEKEILLPVAITMDGMQKTFKNGILELRFKRA